MIILSPRRRPRSAGPSSGPGSDASTARGSGRSLALAPERLQLHLPPQRPPGWRDALLGLAAAAALFVLFFASGQAIHYLPFSEEEVQVLETEPPPPPPPPPKLIKEPPKPKPPPPQEKAPPPPPEPPKPQFGLDKDATGEKGDLSVASGNTLMKKADSVVKPAPPPPAPEPAQLNQEPEAMDKVVPKYPEWAEEQGVTSRVLVMVTIDAEGKVIDVRVQKSGGKDFDQAALEAARATRYKPYVEKGRPLPARFVVDYQFVL